MDNSYLKKIIWTFLIGIVLIALCYLYVDKPAADFAFNHHLERFSWWLKWPTYTLVIIFFVTAISIILTTIRWCARVKVSHFEHVFFVASINTWITAKFKDILKYTFGRTWPATWTNNNPSWLNNHVYGFHFFHGGGGYASFPSGHMTVTLALITVLWIHFPKWRPLFAIIALSEAVALIGLYYHFVSDVLAGSLLGFTTGMFASRAFLPQPRK